MITKKQPPYANTEADPEKTRGQIDKLFREYGVEGVRWTSNYTQNIIILEFGVEAEIQGQKKVFLVKVSPPLIYSKHKTWNSKSGRYETINSPNYAQSYRLLYYWLKSKLEAISYGLSSAEKEFLGDILVKMPNGKQATVSEFLSKNLSDMAALPSSDDDKEIG